MKRRTCIAAATCAALAGAIIASAVVIVAGRHADGVAVDEIDCAFGRIAQSLDSGGNDGGFMVELTEEFAYREGIGLGGGTNEYVFKYFADENGPVIYMHNDDDRDVYVIDGMCYDVSRGISAIYPVEQMSSIYRISALEKVCSMSYYSVIFAVNCEQGRLSVSLSDQLCNYDLGGYAAPEAQTYIYSVDDFSLCQKVVGETERESVGEHYYPQYYPALGMLDQLFTQYGELDGYEVLFNTTDDECSIALYDGGSKEYVCVFPVQRYNGNPALLTITAGRIRLS